MGNPTCITLDIQKGETRYSIRYIEIFIYVTIVLKGNSLRTILIINKQVNIKQTQANETRMSDQEYVTVRFSSSTTSQLLFYYVDISRLQIVYWVDEFHSTMASSDAMDSPTGSISYKVNQKYLEI